MLLAAACVDQSLKWTWSISLLARKALDTKNMGRIHFFFLLSFPFLFFFFFFKFEIGSHFVAQAGLKL